MALVARVQGILLRPKQEWQVIDAEQTTTSDLYRSYVIPLAAIPAAAQLIGSAIFGVSLPFVGAVRVPITTAITQAIVTYVLSLASVYVLALVTDQLATNFGGTRSMMQALKVSAYGATAQWVAGVFAVIPLLSILTILGVYSLYLFYLGVPVLMKVPQERALTYTVAVIVVAIVLSAVVGAIVGAMVGGYSYF